MLAWAHRLHCLSEATMHHRQKNDLFLWVERESPFTFIRVNWDCRDTRRALKSCQGNQTQELRHTRLRKGWNLLAWVPKSNEHLSSLTVQWQGTHINLCSDAGHVCQRSTEDSPTFLGGSALLGCLLEMWPTGLSAHPAVYPPGPDLLFSVLNRFGFSPHSWNSLTLTPWLTPTTLSWYWSGLFNQYRLSQPSSETFGTLLWPFNSYYFCKTHICIYIVRSIYCVLCYVWYDIS